MPVAEAVLRGDWAIGMTGGAKVRERYETRARASVRINAQAAHEMLVLAGQKRYQVRRDFPTLTLPYPSVWVEYGADGVHVALSIEYTADQDSIVTSLLWCSDEHPDGDPGVRVCPVMNFVDVSPTGVAGDEWMGPLVEGARFGGLDTEEADNFNISLVRVEALVGKMAVSLMNCKNVAVEDAGRLHVKRSKRDKRSGKSANLRFSTIVLPGMTTGRTAAERAANQDMMARHRVRGHFKTFTEDAPLFGKVVGTFWWGWQVRGNAKNGVVVSDYKIGDAS